MVNHSNTPLVSIALCTYNGEQFLQQQLDTIINQTYQNLELVIVDDGSTDSTISIVESYADKDSRIKFFRNEANLGYVKNFEKAISLCNGDFIALSDQDDLWDLNKIQILLDEIGDNVLIYHNSELIDDQGNKLGLMSDVLDMYQGDDPMALVFYNSISGHACMFKNLIQPHLVNFNPAFYHDWFIAFVAASFGPIKYINKLLVKYRQHSKAITDMLPLKIQKNKEEVKQPKFSEFKMPVLKYLAQVKGKAHKDINQMIYLFEHNTSKTNSLKLFLILLRNYKGLYFYTKNTPMEKSDLSRINYLRKVSTYKGFM